MASPTTDGFRNFGDLYLSLADYSSFEDVKLEYNLYLDILFREHIFAEESIFFIKDTTFQKLAESPKGHVHSAIRDGIIRLVTKDSDAVSFQSIAAEYPHIRRRNPSLKPETLHDDMMELARRYDRMYLSSGRNLSTRVLTIEGTKHYNHELRRVLQIPQPPPTSILEHKHLQDLWTGTERFRYEWVEQVIAESDRMGFRSAPKTAFNKLGAALMGVEYTSLRELIQHAPSHPEGRHVVAFLRWVHEIFYYSRSQVVGAATTYAVRPGHITIPSIRTDPDPTNLNNDGIEFAVRLPKLSALSSMSTSKFIALRKIESASEFFLAIHTWQHTRDAADAVEVKECLTRYSQAICDAASKNNESGLVEL